MGNSDLVIRVKDNYGSYFCGFSDDNKSVKLSLLKENAVLYDEKENKVRDDIIKIIQLSQGKLLCAAQRYSLAPNFAN